MKKQDAKGKPAKKAKRLTDVNQLMHHLGAQSTKEAEPSEADISRVMSAAAVALYYFVYNFIKIHGTLRCTPARPLA